MPDVSSIGTGPVGPIDHGTHRTAAHRLNGTDRSDRADDRVEVSEHARFLDRIRQLPDIRMDRVREVRDAIDAGRYETEERLDTALERLVQDLDD